MFKIDNSYILFGVQKIPPSQLTPTGHRTVIVNASDNGMEVLYAEIVQALRESATRLRHIRSHRPFAERTTKDHEIVRLEMGVSGLLHCLVQSEYPAPEAELLSRNRSYFSQEWRHFEKIQEWVTDGDRRDAKLRKARGAFRKALRLLPIM